METRKLWGKHHRTNILHISQRIGIIVIVVTTKYNPNCTPSNIKKIWSWQSQTDEISTIFWMLRWRPNPTRSPGPLQRSFESYCGRWSDSMSFDEVWKEVGLSENGLSMNIPNLILHWQCCCHFQTRVCSRIQTLPRIQSFPISASGPREILHADFLGASDFVPRRMPLSSKSVHSATKEENMKNMAFEANRYQFRINVNPGLVNP